MSKAGNGAARAANVEQQSAVLVDEPTAWPTIKCVIAPAELLRIKAAMVKEKRFRRRADLLRAVISAGLESMGY